jgi:hypothetical protein
MCYFAFAEQATFLPSRCIENDSHCCKDARCDGEWGLGSPNKFGGYKMLCEEYMAPAGYNQEVTN